MISTSEVFRRFQVPLETFFVAHVFHFRHLKALSARLSTTVRWHLLVMWSAWCCPRRVVLYL